MANLERLLEPSKVFKGTATVTADGLLNFHNITPEGGSSPYLDLSDVDWERIVVDLDVSAASGTSPTLDVKGKTLNVSSGTAIATGTCNAIDGGGTAFAMTQATAATREIKALGRRNADADAAGVSNVGKYFALYGDVGGTSPSFTITYTVYVGK